MNFKGMQTTVSVPLFLIVRHCFCYFVGPGSVSIVGHQGLWIVEQEFWAVSGFLFRRVHVGEYLAPADIQKLAWS